MSYSPHFHRRLGSIVPFSQDSVIFGSVWKFWVWATRFSYSFWTFEQPFPNCRKLSKENHKVSNGLVFLTLYPHFSFPFVMSPLFIALYWWIQKAFLKISSFSGWDSEKWLVRLNTSWSLRKFAKWWVKSAGRLRCKYEL